ncbi:MAG: protein-tyrosine-phosphatase [Flavobacteriaceae bacterium]|jgi:protein-tyrosine phosphatase|nr:protein-tyrosine-phosphatase [Flavobacteriaceae bacterium]HBY67077.1 protein-tyrosine-phosphatase [Flavobacteriaceae bacterium]|tara:strand:- start:25904 stop:26356 length:453 start_codon:yes stop_codon:yes gene_type:complete
MKTKVLMVCLGNICRSPLAEGLLKSKVDTSNIYVTSAGTGHWHVGDQPDPRSIAVAKKNGLNITDQRGRQFKAEDFNEFDYIFVMDNSNKENVLKLAKTEEDKAKVQLILDEIFPGENVDVPDPYYGGDSGFDNVYNMLDEACEKIANRI